MAEIEDVRKLADNTMSQLEGFEEKWVRRNERMPRERAEVAWVELMGILGEFNTGIQTIASEGDTETEEETGQLRDGGPGAGRYQRTFSPSVRKSTGWFARAWAYSQQKLKDMVVYLRGIVAALAKAVGATGFSLGANFPWGVSVSLNFDF